MRVMHAMAERQQQEIKFEVEIDSGEPLPVIVRPATAEQIRNIQKEGKTLIEIMVHTIIQRSLMPPENENGKARYYFSEYDSDFVLKFPPSLIVTWWAEIMRPPRIDRKEWQDEIGKNLSEILFEGCGLTTL